VSTTSRPEAAFVLIVLQATFWAMAGLSALPFVLGGEVYMLALGAVSMAFALAAACVAVGLVRRRRWARRTALIVEWISLVGSLALIALPIGANKGPVALLVNVVLPASVILLLRGKRMRAEFAAAATTATGITPAATR
jgi:hypothetical protein